MLAQDRPVLTPACSSPDACERRLSISPAPRLFPATPAPCSTNEPANILHSALDTGGMTSMTRRPILSARSANHQIGYIEGRKAFDMFGNACADYEEGTGLLRDTKNDELLGYISLRNAFVAAKLGAEKSIFRTEGVGALQVTFTDHASGAAAQMDISVQRPSTKTAPADAGAGAVDDEHEPDPAGQRGTNGG